MCIKMMYFIFSKHQQIIFAYFVFYGNTKFHCAYGFYSAVTAMT